VGMAGMLSERPICFFCWCIEAMHNSNRQLRQVTLSSEVLLEYQYYVIGFVARAFFLVRAERSDVSNGLE
jgi:hypothetical protein